MEYVEDNIEEFYHEGKKWKEYLKNVLPDDARGDLDFRFLFSSNFAIPKLENDTIIP